MNVAWVVLHCNRRIGARERRQLMPHVRFQVPFLGPESQLKSGFACAGLLCTLRTLEDTHAVLQQTELLAGVINEQDCRDIRTACCCIRSLRIRVEARANVTEREVISRQLQLMHASVQHYRTEDLNTADTSCLSRTSFEHFEDRPGPWAEKNARIPTPM